MKLARKLRRAFYVATHRRLVRGFDLDASAPTWRTVAAKALALAPELPASAVGRAVLRLGGGRWWIHARSPDPQDPYAEWYWNLPLPGGLARLGPETGARRPRY